MLKKTITYSDYNGEERTETLYFNLSKAEVIELEMTEEGGLERRITEAVENSDSKKMFDFFKNIILMSYGEKTPDGKRFVKSDEIRKAFSESEAYSELFFELVTDSKSAADFFNGIVPNLDTKAKQ